MPCSPFLCITVVENMSCQGNTVRGNFEELGQIIQRVKDKSRVGVCLDTCHAFAAGYNLKSEDGFHKMMDAFERDIGLKYLKAVHVNDSKGKIQTLQARLYIGPFLYTGMPIFR